MNAPASPPRLTPPGPGVWQLDVTHFPRPLTRPLAEILPAAFSAGQVDWIRRYGIPLRGIQAATVDGFVYVQPQPLAGKAGAAPPPRWLFWLIARLAPPLRACARVAEEALATRRWRADAEAWRDTVFPSLVKDFEALHAVTPATLDDAALLEHLADATRVASASLRAHFASNAATMVPTALLLGAVTRWIDARPDEVVVAVGRGSPEVAADERRRETVVALLGEGDLDGPPAAALARLRARDDALGAATRAWLARVEHRQAWAGDLWLPTNAELPQLLVAQLRLPPRAPSPADPAAPLRARIPAAHQAEFEALLAEARATAWLRDERSTICDGWSAGLLRRAHLAVGARLVERGRLPRAELAIHLTPAEARGLLLTGEGPGAAQVEAWAQAQARPADAAPLWLGGPPAPPPPMDVLPGALGRIVGGMMRYLDAMEGDLSEDRPADQTGLPASGGTYIGVVRVVEGLEEMARVQPGEVLVARTTMPSYNGALAIAGAVVTERGGALSHAAIVARELGIPAVVGVRGATRTLRTGARVRVDGTAGTVELLP